MPQLCQRAADGFRRNGEVVGDFVARHRERDLFLAVARQALDHVEQEACCCQTSARPCRAGRRRPFLPRSFDRELGSNARREPLSQGRLREAPEQLRIRVGNHLDASARITCDERIVDDCLYEMLPIRPRTKCKKVSAKGQIYNLTPSVGQLGALLGRADEDAIPPLRRPARLRDHLARRQPIRIATESRSASGGFSEGRRGPRRVGNRD